jgi:hypothetical protein
MQGLLETPGLTVAGHLVHGQVKEAPYFAGVARIFFMLPGSIASTVSAISF